MSSNLYRVFRSLIPATPLQVGEVATVAGGMVEILLPGGGRISARGEAEVGSRVFVRDGVIEGPAPDLAYTEIEI